MAQYSAELWLMSGALILGLAVPFIAVLMLDSIVGSFQHRGVKALAGAIVMTLVTGGVGYALWTIGMQQSAGAPIATESRELMRTLLLFTVPAAAVAFVIRTIWALSRSEPRH